MDALNLNLVQGAAVAGAGLPADSAPPSGDAGGRVFSALLALGLNPCGTDAAQVQIRDDSEPETAIVADAQGAVPSPELLIALPQLQNADARAGATLTAPGSTQPQGAQAPKAAQLAAPAAASENARAAAAADETANIAAHGAQAAQPAHLRHPIESVEQRAELVADPRSGQGFALDALRANSEPSRSEPLHHPLQVHPAETRAPLSAPSALLEVKAPVSEPGFAQALSRHVVWMVDKDAQVAELRINPPELGPVEVRLTLTQDSAAAEFVSPHAEVRAAIESSIARLREAMADAGIQLGEASVSAESFSQRADTQAESRQSRDGYREAAFAGASSSPARPIASAVTLARGLVDVFA
jgi:flagellar hook-length control protein FliK